MEEQHSTVDKVTARVGLGSSSWVMWCILFVQLCENLAFVSIATNVLLFCTNNLDVGVSQASTISLVFSGATLVLPLFGGWFADSRSGRYNTILLFGLLYCLGLGMLCLSAMPYSEYFGKDNDLDKTLQWTLFAASLALISAGTGGIKANVSPFGVDQLQQRGSKAIQTFFAIFFWLINIGAIVARLVVVYVQTDISFFYGFLIPFVLLSFAMLLFVSGRRSYICRPHDGSVIPEICKIGFKAAQRRLSSKQNGITTLDHARICHGGVYSDDKVDSVSAILSTLPVFFCFIFYYTIFFQMQSSYLVQGLSMDLQIGTFRIPPASLGIFDTLAVLIFVPLFDRILYPYMAKRGLSMTMLRRMGIGMICAMLSVAVAGLVEEYRRNNVNYIIQNTFSGNVYNASAISIFMQVPQFALIGFSEVFTITSGFEFASSQSPVPTQGLMMGLFYAMAGLGSFVGSGLVNLVKYASGVYTLDNWYPDDVNTGRLDYYFYLLAVLMLANFAMFCMFATKYRYVDPLDMDAKRNAWRRCDEDINDKRPTDDAIG